MKRSKLGSRANTYPRVVLQPFMADPTDQHRCHYTTEPATASLFNKPQYSDLKLKVGQECFYAHRVVLCAASEVFSVMLNNGWAESKNNELVLHEEGACAKVFDRFLYFCYSGSITISESYVIPLFTLADKYDVKPLYEECIKIIEQGLKVYVVHSSPSEDSAPSVSIQDDSIGFSQNSASGSSSSDDSTSSDPFDSDDSSSHETPSTSFASHQVPLSPIKTAHTLRLIGSETFPISVVIKMIQMWHNTRLSTAALYNLEARLGNQILQDNFINWSSLSQDLITQMLADSHFCYGEYILFRAAKAWLEQEPLRQVNEVISAVLCHIRYPLLEAHELYEVEKSSLVQTCEQVKNLIQEAMRYQLFQNFCSLEDKAKWNGTQFQLRKPRPR
ncbi:hypothetical protein LSH36_613g01018 [Paralvinella palmiformis]|uniref:BTB domain-containing protein n=1 Tax=Paralvinella palmiformis TaxID=53620 RepID=A0AAD9J479_9ANNE|nr:hypothetical protein LSH36_613g01018 [Paralvinella palmiformis]